MREFASWYRGWTEQEPCLGMPNNVLMVCSLSCLALGLVFPVAARTINPFMAYGIVFVSWPAWTIGAISGGVLGFRQHSSQGSSSAAFEWGWVLCVANVVAAFATALISFYAS